MCGDAESASVLQNYTDLMQTLAYITHAKILTTEQAPIGCAIRTVSAKCKVHLFVKVHFCFVIKSLSLFSNVINKFILIPCFNSLC